MVDIESLNNPIENKNKNFRELKKSELLKEKKVPTRELEYLEIGNKIFEFFKDKEGEGLQSPNFEKKPPGRPKKHLTEKVRNISIKIRPEYLKRLDDLSFGKGRGSKVRNLMDERANYKKRENNQLKYLKRALKEVSDSLDKFKAKQNGVDLIKEISQRVKNIKILQNILQFELMDLKILLTKAEYRTIEFVYFYEERRGE